jgi:hypothetical protein
MVEFYLIARLWVCLNMKLNNRLDFNMYMSLFFLFLTILTFLLAYFCSKKTIPQETQSFAEQSFEIKDPHSIHVLIKEWVIKNKRLSIIHESSDYYLVNESPTLLSYGYFYHIHVLTEAKKTIIKISLQAKLVSSPYDKKIIYTRFCENLELKNVS